LRGARIAGNVRRPHLAAARRTLGVHIDGNVRRTRTT
jgi:hypothetical protein